MKTILVATLALATLSPLAAQAQDGGERRAQLREQMQELREARSEARGARLAEAWGGDDRQERRQERRDDRREFRQERREDRREFRQDRWDDRRYYGSGRNRTIYVQPQNYYYAPPRTTYYYSQPSYGYSYGYNQPSYGYGYGYNQPSYGYNNYGYGAGYNHYPSPRRWSRGQYLPHEYRRYIVHNYYDYGYRAPPYGYQYYRTNTGEIILAAIATGLILSVLAGAF